MAAMSDVLERYFLNHLTGNAAYSPASTVYLALSSSAGGFGDDNAGTEVTTTGTGYSRQLMGRFSIMVPLVMPEVIQPTTASKYPPVLL